MAKDHQHKGDKYYDCDICGFTVRYSETSIDWRGYRVCPRCLDEPPPKKN